MQAFHTLWTRPYTMSHPNQPFTLTDFDLLCTVLSAMQWRKNNGSICLVTDSVGAQYFHSCGLDCLWDGGLDIALDAISDSIDPATFWAAGKLFALERQHAPCVMLDTDFIAWDNLSPLLSHADLTVIHREELNSAVYPDPAQFLFAENYRYPDGWDFSLPACNTAFCAITSEALRRSYCQQSLAFIHAAYGHHPLHYMVFAEQRLLPMCAAQHGFSIQALSDLPELFSDQQTSFTHLWGYKQLLIQSPQERHAFCLRCAQRIMRDFPEAAAVCRQHSMLTGYFSIPYC